MIEPETLATLALAVVLVISMIAALLLADRSHLPTAVAAIGSLLAAFMPVMVGLFKASGSGSQTKGSGGTNEPTSGKNGGA